MKRPRKAARIVLALGVVCPATLVLFVLVANVLMWPFLASFQVLNKSGLDVWVTPIGMVEGTGHYRPLGRLLGRPPFAVPVGPRHDIPVPSGTSVTITYCWDDINFRHLLVRAGSGPLRIVDTDTRGTRHSCYAAQRDRYIVPNPANLAAAPAELAPCAAGQEVAYSGAKEYPDDAAWASPCDRASTRESPVIPGN